MEKERTYILTDILGNTVRIKVLENLLKNALEKEDVWLNISKIAKISHISTSSSKRIVDELIEEGTVIMKSIQTHAQNPEREIQLDLDNKIVKELIFFYRKLKGFR